VSDLWWIPLGVAAAGALALGLVNLALHREVDALQRALGPVVLDRRRRPSRTAPS
jgi:hypothetical protein